jgi:uncharacterized beta-barrel protein YwiB (DUF1934 family)
VGGNSNQANYTQSVVLMTKISLSLSLLSLTSIPYELLVVIQASILWHWQRIKNTSYISFKEDNSKKALHNILAVPLKNRAMMKLGLMVAKLQVKENMVFKLYETPRPTWNKINTTSVAAVVREHGTTNKFSFYWLGTGRLQYEDVYYPMFSWLH